MYKQIKNKTACPSHNVTVPNQILRLPILCAIVFSDVEADINNDDSQSGNYVICSKGKRVGQAA
jgi:hypothetical protein